MKNPLGRDALKLSVSKSIILAISLLSNMLLSRFRNLSEYGTYSQIFTIISIAISVFTLGFPTSINYFLSRAESSQERNRFLSTYYAFNTLICILMGLMLVILAPLLSDFFNNELIMSFIYVLAIIPWVKVISSSLDNVLIVYQQTSKLMIVRIITSIVTLLIIIFVRFMNWSFSHYMFLLVISEIMLTIWIYYIVNKLDDKLKLHIDLRLVKEILKFSLPLGVSAIVGTLSLELSKLMIGNLLGTEAVAIYANAGRELPLTIVAVSLTSVLMPQLIKKLKNNDNIGAIKLWGDAVVLSFVFICFFSVACFVFAPQVITILYSEKYIDGVGVFRVYNLILIFRVTYFGIMLNSSGRTKFILVSSIMSLVLNVAFAYLFYLVFGFIGPAIATLLSIALVQVVQLKYTAKVLNLPFSKVFPWKELGRISVINLVGSIAVIIIMRYINLGITLQEIVIAVTIGIIWSGIYFLLTFKTIKLKWKALNS